MSVYSILDALDEEAATEYVEKSGDLKVEIVEKLHLVISLLIEGRLQVAEADVLWPQWWAVISGFTEGYELHGLLDLRRDIEGLAEDEPKELGPRDVLFLEVLQATISGYIRHRESGNSERFGNAAPVVKQVDTERCTRVSPRLRRRH